MPASGVRRALPHGWWLVGTLLVLLAVTALDGLRVAAILPGSQHLATAVTVVWFALLFRRAPPRLRVLMAVGLVSATIGEAIFCLLLGMYGYRLGNLPLYVPPGHTILFATVFLFVRQPWVRRREGWLALLLFSAGAAFCALWWRLHDDVYGMACFGVFAVLFAALPRSRLFLAAMFVLVVYLELCGTWFGCWRWPPVLLGRFEALPSGNPPGGIPVFYVVFDLTCLALYFLVRFRSFERLVGHRMARRSRRLGALHPR